VFEQNTEDDIIVIMSVPYAVVDGGLVVREDVRASYPLQTFWSVEYDVHPKPGEDSIIDQIAPFAVLSLVPQAGPRYAVTGNRAALAGPGQAIAHEQETTLPAQDDFRFGGTGKLWARSCKCPSEQEPPFATLPSMKSILPWWCRTAGTRFRVGFGASTSEILAAGDRIPSVYVWAEPLNAADLVIVL